MDELAFSRIFSSDEVVGFWRFSGFFEGGGEKACVFCVVFLWWIGGVRCPLAGPYKPGCCLANFFVVFEIYFGVVAGASRNKSSGEAKKQIRRF